ncbi:hypothetical protein FS837_005761 [Tulasnella sp. UAMH 9824]|nr:hypothetical protein FS837_005761 [Tulasnella sp. UAMH 9824]
MGPPATNAAAGHQQTPSTVINNLPVEVFHIIILLASSNTSAGRHYYDRLRTLRLVSTSWSTLIDNCPQCWSIISCSYSEPEWRMALEKSRQADIDVYCASSQIRYSMGLEIPTMLTKAIVVHMPRVRKLSVLDEDLAHLIANAPTAPRLRSLELLSHARSTARDYGPIALPFHPAQWAPGLRDVSLIHSYTAWAEVPWSNLETLHVHMNGVLPVEEIFTILAASPDLRSLTLQGLMQSRRFNHQRPISPVKLDALESMTFLSGERGMPFETLQSIIASPKSYFLLSLNASEENLRAENLRSIGRFASCIVHGRAGSVLTLGSRQGWHRMDMGNFRVEVTSQGYDVIKLLEVFTHLVEGLSPQQRLAVKTVEVRDMDSTRLVGLLPIISSLCPNTSYLITPTLDRELASSIGDGNNGWIFPRLKFLSITRYRGGRYATKAIEPRVRALKSREQLAKLKMLALTFFLEREVDETEIAELDALVPKVIVNYPRANEWERIGNNSAEDLEVARKTSRLNRPDDCAFCNIIAGKQRAFPVFEDDHTIAILDILPIRTGHALVIPKQHISRLSELPEEVAGRLGQAVTKVAGAIARALDNTALNVVCNQEYAQAVPHVHYHIVPAPSRGSNKPTLKTQDETSEKEPSYHNMLKAELLLRDELDDQDGQRLADLIRAKL